MNVSRVAWRRIRIDEEAVRRLVEEGRAVLRPAARIDAPQGVGSVGRLVEALQGVGFGPVGLTVAGLWDAAYRAGVVGLADVLCPWGRPGDLVGVAGADVWARVQDVGVELDGGALWWRVVLVLVESPVTFRPLRVIPRRSA